MARRGAKAGIERVHPIEVKCLGLKKARLCQLGRHRHRFRHEQFTCHRQLVTGKRQRQQFAVNTQSICRLAEGLAIPMAVSARRNILDPAAKTLHGSVRERQQVRTGGLLLGQPVVEQLFQGPGGFPEFGESDHACTAFERVKGSAKRGLLAQVRWISGQAANRVLASLNHFSGFFQKNIPDIEVIIVQRLRCRHGHKLVNHRLSDRNRGWQRFFFHKGCERLRQGHLWHQLLLSTGQWQLHPLKQVRLHRIRLQVKVNIGQGLRGCRRLHSRRLLASHQWLELALFLVISKQLLGHRTLVTQHVDEKSQSTQAVTQFFKNAGTRGLQINIVHQESLHAVAHAQRGNSRLIQTQNRKHTPHLCKLAGHLVQRFLIYRVAEKRIQQFFDLAQGGAQLVHHTAHDLTVADPAVQLLHPALQRLRLPTRVDMLQPSGQVSATLGHMRIGWIQVLIRGFKVKHRGRHLHCQRGARRLARASGRLDGISQGVHQVGTLRMQFQHRISHQAELVNSHLQPIGIAPCQRRPGLGGGCKALAGLHQQGRIKAPELGLVVIE